jgi:serine/threonine protein kinase
MSDLQVQIQYGKLFINGKLIDIGGFAVMHEVSRGANGIVIIGKDEYLNRTVAVKIWLKLRHKDKRDKISQGIAEARKAYAAAGHQVVNIFNAGVSGGHFFIVMEYFDGPSLRTWLARTPPPSFLWCWNLAEGVLSCAKQHSVAGIFHGDLHLGNILVRESGDGYFSEGGDFKIIDFGTSLFSNRGFSMRRHNKLLLELIDTLLSPFKFLQLMSKSPEMNEVWATGTDDPNFVSSLLDYVTMVREGLGEYGYFRRWTSQDGQTFQHDIFDPAIFRNRLPNFERQYGLKPNPLYLEDRED